jgi:hypothetical protein
MAITRDRWSSMQFGGKRLNSSVIAHSIAAALASLAPVASSHAGGWSGFGCVPQDLNADGVVNAADLAILLGAWGLSEHPADFNGINGVDGADLGSMLGAWGPWPLAACLEVDSIEPTTAGMGDIVSLAGHFPDPNVENYCLVSMNDAGGVIPFEVISVDGSKLKARVGPSNAQGTTFVMIGLGDGDSGLPGELTPGVGYGDEPWSWSTDAGGLMTEVAFKLERGSGISGSFYGTLDGGALKVVINGDCAAGTKFAIWPRAHHYATGPGDPYVGFDCYIPCIEIYPGSDEFSCAQQICSVITNVYAAHVPPIAVTCSVATVAGGTELTLKLNGLNIDWGVFNIEVLSDDIACGPGPGNCSTDCPCDVNGDGQVNEADLLFIQNSFGACPGLGVFCCADLNGDSEVNAADVAAFLACAPCPVQCNPACPCDVNGDGVVNDIDLQQILNSFGTCDGTCCEDFDGDGIVGATDMLLWFTCSGGCVPGGCSLTCPCDVNADGAVDDADLNAIVAAFGPCDLSCCEDLNGDGTVNTADVAVWLACESECVPPICNADCPCDVNVDGAVDTADLAFIQGHFGPCDGTACCTDLDGDGDTDGADVQAWLSCGFGCNPG